MEVELWLENNRSFDSLVSSYNESEEEIKEKEEEEEDDLEYFDTFPTIEELSTGLESRRKPLNPKKTYNFVKRVRGLKVFVGNFTYECDFVVLKDTTSVIDHYLGGMVLGKPFVKKSGFVYDREEGTVMFEKDNEKITFNMPHKRERFKHIDIKDLKTGNIPPFVIENDDSSHEKTYYSDSLNLGTECKQDESVTKSIQCLIKMKSMAQGGVM
ncbi:protein kinase-like domain, concanavalin A-like lectin/glucanase domain protein [Tanacetum coccineum]